MKWAPINRICGSSRFLKKAPCSGSKRTLLLSNNPLFKTATTWTHINFEITHRFDFSFFFQFTENGYSPKWWMANVIHIQHRNSPECKNAHAHKCWKTLLQIWPIMRKLDKSLSHTEGVHGGPSVRILACCEWQLVAVCDSICRIVCTWTLSITLSLSLSLSFSLTHCQYVSKIHHFHNNHWVDKVPFQFRYYKQRLPRRKIVAFIHSPQFVNVNRQNERHRCFCGIALNSILSSGT